MKQIVSIFLLFCIFCTGCGRRIWVPVETYHSYNGEEGQIVLIVDSSDIIVGGELLSLTLENRTDHLIGYGALPFSIQKLVDGIWCELERETESTTAMWYGILPGETYQAKVELGSFVGTLQTGTYRATAAFFPTEDSTDMVYLYTEFDVEES